MFAYRVVVVGLVTLLGMQRVDACDHPIGTIVSTEGTVEVRRAAAEGQGEWSPARVQLKLCANDQIAVRERSRAAVEMINQIVVRLDQHTTLTLQKLDADQPAEIGLLEGIVHVLTRFTNKFSVITPYLNAMVEGTEFTVVADVQAQRGQITVAEGKVRAANQYGEQLLIAGNTVIAAATEAPAAPLTIKPRDAIQWALYYPQIVHLQDAAIASLDEPLRSKFSTARTLADRGQYQQALTALGEPEEFSTSPALQAWYANLLLSVGRLDEARAVVDRNALSKHEQLALQSLIATVLGNSSQALQLARQALAVDANSAAAQLALSLAWQSQGEIPQAMQAAQRATELDSQFAMAWTRVAELELLNANAKQGRAAAEHALQINQDTPKANSAIGFAELMAGHYQQAQQSFERAKQSEAPDAQAWLGSGLVLIHEGQLSEGRQHLEIAAMLDPGNAELRNILTRAYLKEGRDAVALKELGLAERLDPANPGPWFTDALRKQQLNDPVSALQAYQQSLALNDQRAVVRPRTLLDQDKAGRMLSLASTYRDLGFDGLMLSTAERAVAADPSSSAAHAFLAEAYAATPRYETARVSEQLQSQLRAPIGMAPVPPQSLITTLPIVGGARAFTLQEFTPLLDRNSWGLQLGGLWGTQSTRGSSAAAFKAWDNFQVSAGHFYYDTDSAVNDVPIRLSANNLLFQWQLTPGLQAQLEGRTERRDGGDVTQRIDPLAVEPERHRYLKNDSMRFGLIYEPSAQTQWLMSAVRADRENIDHRKQIQPVRNFFVTRTFDETSGTRANYVDGSYHHQGQHWQVMAGGGVYRDQASLTVQGQSVPSDPTIAARLINIPAIPLDVDDLNAYTYAGYRLGKLDMEGGVSWSSYRNDNQVIVKRFNPKVGISYAWPRSSVGIALFNGVKGAFTHEQDLAPPLFSGFTQVFDDNEGTRYHGVAIKGDHNWADNIWVGAKLSKRSLLIPNLGCPSTSLCYGSWQEYLHSAYVSWIPGSRWAVAIEGSYQELSLNEPLNLPNSRITYPIGTRTWQLPVAIKYIFNQWQLGVQWRGVRQYVYVQDSNVVTQAASSFGVVNMSMRYGATSSHWSVLAEINNALNKKFEFQNSGVSGDDPRVPLFWPSRVISVRADVRF